MRLFLACIPALFLASSLTWNSEARAQEVSVDAEIDMQLEGMPPPASPGGVMPPSEAGTGEGAAISSPSVLQANAALMDRLLTESTEKTIVEQKFAAAAGITGGVILLGLGSWRLIEDTPQSQFSRGLGVMFLTLGAADLTTGIFAATRAAHEVRRLERWEKLRADGIDELDLARVEGELQAASEMRRGERLLVRWNGLTHAIAGVLVFSFAPIPSNSRTDKISAYVVGSLFVATGMTAFGLSFRPTPSEEAWETYQANKVTAATKTVTWQVAPSVSRTSFGIGVAGRF